MSTKLSRREFFSGCATTLITGALFGEVAAKSCATTNEQRQPTAPQRGIAYICTTSTIALFWLLERKIFHR